MNFNYSDLTDGPSAFACPAASRPQLTETLEIIAQPQYSSKLRYRSDYTSNPNRRGVLQSRSNSNYRSPAIRIPNTYRNVAGDYFIRVCLVTVEHEASKRRYIHPYDLEDAHDPEKNDRSNNAVSYPIQAEDIGGIKSFPYLRVVKKKGDDLKNYGNLRMFDSSNRESIPQLPTVKETIKEFNLDNAQLAFTVGQKISGDDNLSVVLSATTVFSDTMSEYTDEIVNPANVPTGSSSVESRTTSSSGCTVYKYAPQYGQWDRNEPVLIFFTTKLEPKKYGDLEVIFECQQPTRSWSEPVLDLEVRDKMVSFQTPKFWCSIDRIMPVHIVIGQKKRTFQPLQYIYLPSSNRRYDPALFYTSSLCAILDQCHNCQRLAIEYTNSIEETNANKRRRQDSLLQNTTTDSRISSNEGNAQTQELDVRTMSGTMDQPYVDLFSEGNFTVVQSNQL